MKQCFKIKVFTVNYFILHISTYYTIIIFLFHIIIIFCCILFYFFLFLFIFIIFLKALISFILSVHPLTDHDTPIWKSKSLVCDEFLFLLPPDWSKNSCNSCFDVLWLYFDSRPDSDAVAEQTYVCLLAKNYIFCDSKRRKRSWK